MAQRKYDKSLKPKFDPRQSYLNRLTEKLSVEIMSLHKRTKRRPTYNEYGIKNGVVIEIERVVDGLSATLP